MVGLLPLAVMGLIVWGVIRVVRGSGASSGAGGTRADVSVRRLFVYALLFGSLVMTTSGWGSIMRELLRVDALVERSPETLARSLALTIVGAPTWAVLARRSLATLADNSGERASLGWFLYLNLVLGVAVTTTMFAMLDVLGGLAAQDLGRSDLVAGVVTALVWGLVGAGHWRYGLVRFGVRGDLHFAYGSAIGLITLAVGLIGTISLGLGRLYEAMFDTGLLVRTDTGVSRSLVSAAVGTVVWWWYWLRRYRLEARTGLWHILVVLIGALVGFVGLIAAVARGVFAVLVWLLGDPGSASAAQHFDVVPDVVTVVIVGSLSWRYHRSVLHERGDPARTDAIRASDYLLAASGLVTAASGATVLVVAALEAIVPVELVRQPSGANTVLAALTMLIVGAPVWWHHWASIERIRRQDRAAERESPVRSTYLVGLFGVGGVAVIASLVGVLYTALRDLLAGEIGWETLHDARVGTAIVVAVAGVAWYHLGIWRAEVGLLQPDGSPVLASIIVFAAEGESAHAVRSSLARDATLARRVTVTWWRSLDGTHSPPFDPALVLDDALRASTRSVLVVVSDGGAQVLPYVDEGSEGP